MKILHTSDIHIDSPMTARLPSSKVRERRRELLANFSDLVAEGIARGAEALIIAGDLFDSESVTKKSKDTVLDTIGANPKITFFYLKGNHEGDALTESSNLPKNLLVFGNEWTYFQADGLTIAGRSLCSSDMFDSLNLPENTKNVVVLHGEVRDRSMAPDVIGLADASGRNIDYMALGHYHKYSVMPIDKRGVAVYSGTPEGRGFDEVGERGFVMINTDAGLTHEFIPFARRTLREIALPLDEITQPSQIIEEAEKLLSAIPSSDLVRLVLSGEYIPELWHDTDSLLRRFGDRFYHFEVKDESKIKIDPETYKNDKSFKGEFIRLVQADESLDDEKKASVIACGLYALMGESIFDV